MWDIEILGIDLYHIIAWLYIYSFLGWVWESTYVSVKNKKLVNRGFVTGPVCTIYGVGAVSVYLILKPLDTNWFLLYIGGVVVTTVLEYVTATIMEKLFHTSWWDYSDKKYNLQGRICLGSSVAWGFFTLLMFKVLHPFVASIVDMFDVYTGQITIIVVTIIYAVDFTFAALAAVQLGKRLEQMEKNMEELAKYFQETKIYESAAEFLEKLEPYRHGMTRVNVKEKMEAYQASLEKRIERLGITESKEAVKEKLKGLSEKLNIAQGTKSWRSRRLLRAYPNLGKASRLKRKSLKEIRNNGRCARRIALIFNKKNRRGR